MFWSVAFLSTVGVVFSGLVHSTWALATGHPVGVAIVREHSVWSPLRGLILVFSAPVLLFRLAIQDAGSNERGLFAWKPMAACVLALTQAFIQGVVLLSVSRFV